MAEEHLERTERINPYRDFLASENVPIIEGVTVDCLFAELAPWERLGGRGAYLELAHRGDYTSHYLAEIPPGGALKPERHLYDEMIFVLQGRGATAIELPGGKRHTFEWGPSSLFAIPLNAPHQHFNGSGSEPVRFVAATNLRIMINLYRDTGFIFDNPLVFEERYGKEGYFQGEGALHARGVRTTHHYWDTNFVPDLRSFSLMDEWKERGAGGSTIQFVLADSPMTPHMSSFPVGTYKKAHRHGGGANIFCVTGRGYTLQYLERQDPLDAVRCDWRPGTYFTVLDQHFHQHFNTSAEPARYLVFGMRPSGVRYELLESRTGDTAKVDTSLREGGWQLEYEDEDPRILQMFEDELAESGIESRMRPLLERMRQNPGVAVPELEQSGLD